MNLTIFLSQFLGLVLLSCGLGFAFHIKHYQTVLHDILRQGSLKFFASLIPLVIGVFLILLHSIWIDGWAILVSIIAWCIFLKGLSRVLCPNGSDKLTQKCIASKTGFRIISIVAMILGLLLCYHGFFNDVVNYSMD